MNETAVRGELSIERGERVSEHEDTWTVEWVEDPETVVLRRYDDELFDHPVSNFSRCRCGTLVLGEAPCHTCYQCQQHSFEATRTNGVYLLMVKSEREGYTVCADGEPIVVTNLRLNGHQFSLNGRAELEVTDVKFRSDDPGDVTLDLQLDGPSVQLAAPRGTDGGEQ